MGITTFEELTAWARTHCPEEHARLPDLAIYDITRRNGRSMSICVGSIARTVIYRDLISFEDNSLKVHVHLDPNSGALILLAGDNIRLTRSYHDKIQLSEPYCWLWPNLSDSLGLAKFDALVRYALMAQGYDGRLETMSFGIHEVFPQLCSDIARGQDVQNMKSIWEGGRRYDQDLEDDDSEDAHGNGSEGSELAEDFPEEQQNTSVAFHHRLQYLREEFDAFKATLQADYDEFLAQQTKHGAVVKGLRDELGAAERKVHTLEIQLEDSQNEMVKCKQKYKKLQGIMRGAIDEMT